MDLKFLPGKICPIHSAKLSKLRNIYFKHVNSTRAKGKTKEASASFHGCLIIVSTSSFSSLLQLHSLSSSLSSSSTVISLAFSLSFLFLQLYSTVSSFFSLNPLSIIGLFLSIFISIYTTGFFLLLSLSCFFPNYRFCFLSFSSSHSLTLLL